MNELNTIKVVSLCLSIHAYRTLMRVYWRRFSQAGLIYLCLKAGALRSLQNFRPRQHLLQSGTFFFLFSPWNPFLRLQTYWNSKKALQSLPKGLLVNPCKLQMFSQAAHSKETTPSPCKHLSNKKPPPQRRQQKLRGSKVARLVRFSLY